jgi:formylmethanofuran dehydrogenase subunit E
MTTLNELLEASAQLHRHLCPRQVLGVRMGLLAGEVLGLEVPQTGKRLLAIVETDGCASDGVAVAANCWTGRRTLRVADYGKVAATFADTLTSRAVRIAPRLDVRARARDYAPEAVNAWEAQLLGYQRMPAAELLSAQEVALHTPLAWLLSRPGLKVICEVCGEEIMNEREIAGQGRILCRSCAGQGYYDGVMPLPAAAPRVAEPGRRSYIRPAVSAAAHRASRR